MKLLSHIIHMSRAACIGFPPVSVYLPRPASILDSRQGPLESIRSISRSNALHRKLRRPCNPTLKACILISPRWTGCPHDHTARILCWSFLRVRAGVHDHDGGYDLSVQKVALILCHEFLPSSCTSPEVGKLSTSHSFFCFFKMLVQSTKSLVWALSLANLAHCLPGKL